MKRLLPCMLAAVWAVGGVANVEAASVVGFSQPTFAVNQGAAQVELTLTRTGDGLAASVVMQTDNGSASTVPPFAAAVAGVDYVDLTGATTMVEFADGEMSKVVTVTLAPKTGTTIPNKRFSATLSGGTGGAAPGGITTAQIQILATDTTPPTLTLTAPAATAALSVPSPVLVKGTAGDAKGIAKVELTLNGAAPVAVTLGAAASSAAVPWSAQIEPVAGANTLLVSAYDLRGNRTAVTRNLAYTRRYVMTVGRAAPAGIALETAGTVLLAAHFHADAGPLAPATANANPRASIIVPGTIVKLTALAKAGYVLSHWSGLPAGSSNLGVDAVFIMPAGDVAGITAHFVANPFGGAVGSSNTFYGLLRAGGGGVVSNASEGFFSGTLMPGNGSFSGKVLMDGITKTFIAVFNGDGSALFNSTKDPVLGFNGKTMTIVYAGGDMVATVTASGGTSTGIAKRGIYSSTNKVNAGLLNQRAPATAPAPNQGFFTFALPAKVQSPPMTASRYPQGSGFGTMTLTDNGLLTLSGTLADGTTFTGSSALVEGDACAVFAQLTTPGAAANIKGGCFLGTVVFDAADPEMDVSGNDLAWIRPAVTAVAAPATTAAATNLYTAGWPNGICVDARGALYNKAVTVQAGLGLDAAHAVNGNARLSFTDGRLTAPITKTKFNIIGNAVAKIPATDASYTLMLAPATGSLSGTFAPNWALPNAAKPAFKGILLQKGPGRRGEGFFLSNAKNDLDPESGRVALGAPGP